MLGYAWDVWPYDQGSARIAIGHASGEDTARENVERLLDANGNAFFGTVVRPNLTASVCRRTRVPGRFNWEPMTGWLISGALGEASSDGAADSAADPAGAGH